MPYEEGDGEYCTLWREKKVTARKEHRCIECNATIKPGEEYGRADTLYDGQWDSMARCAACLVLAELAATFAKECAQWGVLDEQIGELNCYAHRDKPLPTPHENREAWDRLGADGACEAGSGRR